MNKMLNILFPPLSPLAAIAHESSAAPVPGKDYTVLAEPVVTNVAAGMIEVIEFFWYGSAPCRDFEPLLETWVTKQPQDVVFKRVPIIFNSEFIPYSKLYHALIALGRANQLALKIFDEITLHGNSLSTPDDQANFLAKYAVDPTKFMAAYNSFEVEMEVQRDSQLLTTYKTDDVPTLAVHGRYEIGRGSGNWPRTIQVLEYLVSQVRAGKL